jgi:hypothetical protein
MRLDDEPPKPTGWLTESRRRIAEWTILGALVAAWLLLVLSTTFGGTMRNHLTEATRWHAASAQAAAEAGSNRLAVGAARLMQRTGTLGSDLWVEMDVQSQAWGSRGKAAEERMQEADGKAAASMASADRAEGRSAGTAAGALTILLGAIAGLAALAAGKPLLLGVGGGALALGMITASVALVFPSLF